VNVHIIRNYPIKIFLIISFLILSEDSFSQSSSGWVQIGGTPGNDTLSAGFIIESSKGLLIPRLTDNQIGILDQPPNGLLLYARDQNTLTFNSGNSFSPDWTSAWNLGGNANISPNDYVGTSDTKDFILATSGDPRITIRNASNGGGIGIETANPQQALDVNGGINVGYTQVASDGAIRWSGIELEGWSSIDSAWVSLTNGGTDNDWNTGIAGTIYNIDDKVGIGTSSPVNLFGVAGEASIGATFASQNTPAANGLCIEGNVGIGTSGSSSYGLHVYSPSSSANLLGIYNQQNGTTTGTGYGIYNYNDINTNGTKFGIVNVVNSTGTGERQGIYNSTTGNSISTAKIYGYKSDLSNSGSGDTYSLYLDNAATGSGDDYGIYSVGEDIDYFEGKVGIGTNSPGQKLQVEDNTTDFYGVAYIRNSTAAGGAAIRAYVDNSSPTGTGNRYGLYSAGWYGQSSNYGVYGYGFDGTSAYGVYGRAAAGTNNYGIYGYAATSSGYAIYAQGRQGSTTSATWEVISDRKMKNNIKDLDINALETLLKFKPRKYSYKHEQYAHMNLPVGEQWGFVAQEVGEIIPEMVKDMTHPSEEDEEGKELYPAVKLKSLSLDRLYPLFVKAFQEQQTMIVEMQKNIEKLESKVAELSKK